jgi:hypothetical protein
MTQMNLANSEGGEKSEKAKIFGGLSNGGYLGSPRTKLSRGLFDATKYLLTSQAMSFRER